MPLKPTPPTKPLRRARFWFDGTRKIPGWSAGEYENGWAVPYFDESQLDAACELIVSTSTPDSGYRIERSDDIIEIWIVTDEGGDDALYEYAPVRVGGRLYWPLDGFTWNEIRARGESRKLSEGTHARRLRERGLRVPGWHIGWNSEIGAEAASTGSTRNVLIVATGEDGAPKNLDEPVTVGLFRLGDGEWEETGVRLEFDTFEDAVRLGAKELERKLVRAERS